ncbi:HupE/UreJ family protein [Falsirhodobacter sp. alg1]|uniref:HupE/UreJ family protein n=1 Tax=Falsirhodobacter sp. alg1 TaxID=1472418 RepID=UPI000786A0D2|nr:HupE/UreJ family protein [Falsirhodobacter sp. alg1]
MLNVAFRGCLHMIVRLIVVCAIGLGLTGPAASHALDPAVITALVGNDRVEITIRDAIEPIIAISAINPRSQADADRVNSMYQELRSDTPAALEAELKENWNLIAPNLAVYAGKTPLDLTLSDASIPEVGDTDTLRFSTITITADLPADDTPLTFTWRPDFGPYSIHQAGGDGDGYTELLQGGQTTAPMTRADPVSISPVKLFARFVVSGFEHIVPKGLDHILFVLGLFLFSLRIGPILAQVTAFTLAHTITLALASLKVISLPASVVEPLIAISIVYVAIENILSKNRGVSTARVAVVFCFGLLHGLGFASVLSDVGLPAGQFLVGLIGFNIGVEGGQLFVIVVALALLGLPFGNKPWYRDFIVIPASTAIALIGAWWAFERVFL